MVVASMSTSEHLAVIVHSNVTVQASRPQVCSGIAPWQLCLQVLSCAAHGCSCSSCSSWHASSWSEASDASKHVCAMRNHDICMTCAAKDLQCTYNYRKHVWVMCRNSIYTLHLCACLTCVGICAGKTSGATTAGGASTTKTRMWTSSMTAMLISTRRLSEPLGSTPKKSKPIWSVEQRCQSTDDARCPKSASAHQVNTKYSQTAHLVSTCLRTALNQGTKSLKRMTECLELLL